jgi:hypothetical protein
MFKTERGINGNLSYEKISLVPETCLHLITVTSLWGRYKPINKDDSTAVYICLK